MLVAYYRHGAFWFRSISSERRPVLETLLIFLALLGSFALVGLLVRFSKRVIRPVDETAAADQSRQ